MKIPLVGYGEKTIDITPKNALNIGKAAEHLVCTDLLLNGYQAFLSDQGLPYDVIVDVDNKLLKIQVKGSVYPKNMNARGKCIRIGYNFNARKRGKNGQSKLTEIDCDIIAFVALDIRVVAYLPIKKVSMTMQFSPPNFDFQGKKYKRIGNIDQFTFLNALEEL